MTVPVLPPSERGRDGFSPDLEAPGGAWARVRPCGASWNVNTARLAWPGPRKEDGLRNPEAGCRLPKNGTENHVLFAFCWIGNQGPPVPAQPLGASAGAAALATPHLPTAC